jgi:hypothetical protein
VNRQQRQAFLLGCLALLFSSWLPAGDTYVNMGSGSLLLGQPVVQIQVYTPDDPNTPENEEVVYHPEAGDDWGFSLTSFILDTGANGLMLAKGMSGSVLDTMVPLGFVPDEAQYEEMGVGGSTMYGVSAPYSLDYAGSDGIPVTLDGVRFMCNAENYIEYDGIIGMPAMVNRVVQLDMSVWNTSDSLSSPMTTLFVNAPPTDPSHRYTIPLHMTHFPQDGQQNPGDPLPTWAPIPFLDVQSFNGAQTTSGTFLLDTGAQLSMINNATAVALGLDANGNGVIDLEEASGSTEIAGVGGTQSVPIVSIGGFRLATAEGTDLVWKEFEVLVLDIAPGIDGIIGMDLLQTGWTSRAFGDSTADPGAINLIYFDFRDIADDTAEMIFYLHPDMDAVLNNDAPQVTVTPENGPQSLTETIPFLVAFDQPVTGFTQDDVVITNGVLLGFEEVAAGLAYRVTVQAVAPVDTGGGIWDWGIRGSSQRDLLDDLLDLLGSSFSVRVTVPPLVAQNALGSGNDRGVGEASYDPDTLEATLASTASPATDTTPIPFTLTFSGEVADFTEDRVQLANGTLGNFQTTSPQGSASVFTFDVTPAGNGTVTVTVASVVADGLTTETSYLGTATSVEFNGFPVATPTTDVLSPTDADSVIVTVSFNRQVTGFEQADVLAANAAITGWTEITPGLEYELTVAPDEPGPVAVVVPQGSAQDVANGLDSMAGTCGFESIASFTVERVNLTTFRVRFNRPVSEPLSPFSYTFSPSLDVLGVIEESEGVYLVQTGTQALDTSYFLTVSGVEGTDGAVGDKTEEFLPGEFTVAFTDGNGEPIFIGQSTAANDGLGDGFDQEGDGGTGDQPIVRIVNTTGDGTADFLTCDIRQDDGTTERWFIEVVFPAAQRGTWTFSWQMASPGDGRLVLLQELRDNAPYGPPLDMTSIGEIELSSDAIFEVLSGPPEEIHLQFQEGWNLVGTPLVTTMSARESATGGSARACLLDSADILRLAQGEYESCSADDPLLAEGGYWVRATGNGLAQATCGLRDDGTVQLHQGWNLITPTSACTPGDLSASITVWRWEAASLRYGLVGPDGQLVPGEGYWVYSHEAQLIQFPDPAGR